MLIINPTQKDKDSWYRCGSMIANYLIRKGLPVIHIDDSEKYYFVKTDTWVDVHKKLPWHLRFFEIL